MNRTDAGRQAEDAACAWLLSRGLALIQRNYRVAGGEIDLVMTDADIVVFVEVRARSDDRVMHPVESITPRKRQRLIHAATRYLQDHRQVYTARCRFDVVCLLGDRGNDRFQWIKDAFQA